MQYFDLLDTEFWDTPHKHQLPIGLVLTFLKKHNSKKKKNSKKRLDVKLFFKKIENSLISEAPMLPSMKIL